MRVFRQIPLSPPLFPPSTKKNRLRQRVLPSLLNSFRWRDVCLGRSPAAPIRNYFSGVCCGTAISPRKDFISRHTMKPRALLSPPPFIVNQGFFFYIPSALRNDPAPSNFIWPDVLDWFPQSKPLPLVTMTCPPPPIGLPPQVSFPAVRATPKMEVSSSCLFHAMSPFFFSNHIQPLLFCCFC